MLGLLKLVLKKPKLSFFDMSLTWHPKWFMILNLIPSPSSCFSLCFSPLLLQLLWTIQTKIQCQFIYFYCWFGILSIVAILPHWHWLHVCLPSRLWALGGRVHLIFVSLTKHNAWHLNELWSCYHEISVSFTQGEHKGLISIIDQGQSLPSQSIIILQERILKTKGGKCIYSYFNYFQT